MTIYKFVYNSFPVCIYQGIAWNLISIWFPFEDHIYTYLIIYSHYVEGGWALGFFCNKLPPPPFQIN